jgi:hypothetical protein
VDAAVQKGDTVEVTRLLAARVSIDALDAVRVF